MLNADECTGCMACMAACPVDAIHIKEDKMGVLLPSIDHAVCLDCGLCSKVCKHNQVFNFPKNVYAAYTKCEADQISCASGGIATTLAKKAIESGGVVFGVKYEQGLGCVLQCADTLEEIEAFKGSKYVYAYPGNVYRQIKEVLKDGKEVLFVGTPCQVSGLLSFLGKQKYDRLTTVDLVCHGTPPMKYLADYLKNLKISGDVAKLTFRGENGFSLCAYDAKGRNILKSPFECDLFFYPFMKGLTYRNVCYQCKYSRVERVSDITIGDFWGLDKNALNGYKGRVSLVMVNTLKGEQFWSERSGLFVYETRTVEEAILENHQLKKPMTPHKDREIFEKNYSKKGYIDAVKSTGLYREIVCNRAKRKIKHLLHIIGLI